MIYPESFESKLGFNKIRTKLKSACQSPATATKVENITFSTDKDSIMHELRFTEELKQIVLFHDDFPLNEFPDLTITFIRLSEKTSVLSETEFKNIHSFLDNFNSSSRYCRKLPEKNFQLLKSTFDDAEFPTWVKDRIRQVFTSKGEIKANASKELQELTNELDKLENKIRRSLEQIMRNSVEKGWSPSDTSVSIIDGQRAIPMEHTYKRKISGYVIGESATGKTVYVVPEEFSNTNHQIRNIENAILKEKQRILSQLTDDIREYNDVLKDCLVRLTEIDFQRTKAKLAISLEAIAPSIPNDGIMKFHKARHPILFLNFKKQKREVVPVSFELNTETRFFVISGPNAGGKSVRLQTAGLLQYMLQCGLQIPVGGSTECSLVDNIFIDLGDDQSIENDLSTYSSHLQNMKTMLKYADKKTLILIDEFGGGTDPEMGSAIAEAMLQHLVDKGACGIITTHYSNLKHFASNYPGVENAAMLIDNQNMEPLFQLEVGMPGSSYSFEIAHRSGIPTNILELAKSKVGKDQYSFDKHLRQVIRDKKYWEDKRKELNQKEKKLEAELNRQSVAYEGFKLQEQKILNEAKEQAKDQLKNVNREIENAIRSIKESQADKEKTKAARLKLEETKESLSKPNNKRNPSHEIKNFENTIKNIKPKKPKEKLSKNISEIRIGSTVYIKNLDKHGEIIDIGEKSYVIRLGNMITSIPKEKVELSNKKNPDKAIGRLPGRENYYERILNFKSNIDLRGKRVDEALNELIEFIDNAVVAGAKEVKILHGKGGGILRQVIRDYLSRQQDVESFRDEDIRFGGDGITIVSLRV